MHPSTYTHFEYDIEYDVYEYDDVKRATANRMDGSLSSLGRSYKFSNANGFVFVLEEREREGERKKSDSSQRHSRRRSIDLTADRKGKAPFENSFNGSKQKKFFLSSVHNGEIDK